MNWPVASGAVDKPDTVSTDVIRHLKANWARNIRNEREGVSRAKADTARPSLSRYEQRPMVSGTARIDAVETRTIEDDSLINFVISPGRLVIENTGNTVIAPNMSPATHENIPDTIQKSVSETVTGNDAPKLSSDTNQKGHSHAKIVTKNTKLSARIASIFGGRNKNKGKNQVTTTNSQSKTEVVESHNLEKSASTEKELEQAISDGNMKAVEANQNAEDAPASSLAKRKSLSKPF